MERLLALVQQARAAMVFDIFLNAKGAKISQKRQKIMGKLFCDLCKTSAPFAFKGIRAS
ncbi:hypothetical protein [Ottowia testudinis]|uniref:Uncharacterized protein n=1 Tax=Ottowia testudinis TaxID=2816950 RepID=A0A975H2X3_9BURK|nr:hypothetical protein [Ottowia testudinis]QTD45303.1 hypothetical protein J1M35_20195 [Ottowia testudinis]